MRKVVQKRIVKVVQPEIVEYYCDACGKRCGTKGNPKQTVYSSVRGTEHYCKECKW